MSWVDRRQSFIMSWAQKERKEEEFKDNSEIQDLSVVSILKIPLQKL